MDLTKLQEQIQLLQTVGYTLNVQQRLRLKLAYVNLLSANQNIDELKFWGRIQGLNKSYYVIVGLTYRKIYQFPHKRFFYALSSDFDFKQLPQLLVQHEGMSQKFNNMPFIGDINKILVNLQGQGEGEQAEVPPPEEVQGEIKTQKIDEDDDQIKKIPKKNFTELQRLNYVVRSIENDVQCTPRQSYKMNPEHQLRPNQFFYGLSLATVRNPDSWQHFRSPITPQARQAIQNDLVVFDTGFLDTITGDKPFGSWSIQVDSKQKVGSLRSLLWPGYFAFNKLNTSLFGSVYIGDGTKNIDLPFMI